MANGQTPSKSFTQKVASALIPLAALGVIWFSPPPAGLNPQAWKMLAIFVATILGMMLQPLPSGAIMILGVTFPVFTGILPLNKSLAGFANATVWLIFCAYVLSIGFVKTGLGRRIAYKLISWLGGSSRGIAYALGVSDLILAPAMPSATARCGGVIFPIVRSINAALKSEPGPTGRKIGDYLIMTCFQFGPITGGMFLTGMAANPLCAELARKTLKLDITWMGWFTAALVPGLIAFLIMPMVSYLLIRPELKPSPEVKNMGSRALAEMGAMSGKEKWLILIFILSMLGWGTGEITKLNATTVALGAVSLIFIFKIVDWKDVLHESAAWDTLIWFGAIVSLATGLSDLGFIKWLAAQLSSAFSGWHWLAVFIALGLIYIYIHYAFATATGHTAAVYAPFIATAVAAGAPPMMVAICFGIFTNLMWGLTEYGGGPGPIYFGVGFYERSRFYPLCLVLVTLSVAVMFVVGVPWWKFIGLW